MIDERPAETTARDFALIYESTYLDAIYDRKRLVESIKDRLDGATRVIDVAAGSGFPAIDLKLANPDLTVHVTDADQAMLTQLDHRAREKHLNVDDLIPPIEDPSPIGCSARLDWTELDRIQATYPYVMCRGNSLVYAATWTGETEPARPDAIADALRSMAALVEPGGQLHVDAPRTLAPRSATVEVDGAVVSESVEYDEARHRRAWRVDIEDEHGHRSFVRYSTAITIHDIAGYLDDLGFGQRDVVDLDGERASFGVIIARAPDDWAP